MTDERRSTRSDDMQCDFARLVTSPNARARFARDPVAVAPSLVSLAPERVAYYARALLAKRFHEMRRLLPSAAHARDLRARFAAHAAAFAPGGPGRHREDAIVFARALERAGDTAVRRDRLALEAARDGGRVAFAFAGGRAFWWIRPGRGARLWSGSVRIWRA